VAIGENPNTPHDTTRWLIPKRPAMSCWFPFWYLWCFYAKSIGVGLTLFPNHYPSLTNTVPVSVKNEKKAGQRDAFVVLFGR